MQLLEMTLDQLMTATQQAFPDTTKRQNATSDIRVDSITFVPTDEGLMVKCDVVNTNKGSKYVSSILLTNVEMTNEDDMDAVEVIGADGAKHYVKKFNMDEIDVKVNCTCMDFAFRFALWNYNKDSLLGAKPEAYQRKTDTRPEANPKHSAGVCKHLIKAFESLDSKLSP